MNNLTGKFAQVQLLIIKGSGTRTNRTERNIAYITRARIMNRRLFNLSRKLVNFKLH